jgi:hypothetical protein
MATALAAAGRPRAIGAAADVAAPIPVRRGPRDPATGLIVVIWATIILPRVVQSLTAPKFRTSVGDPVPYRLPANLTSTGLSLLLAGWCLVLVLQRLRNLPTDGGLALAALLAPWVYLVMRDLYRGRMPNLVSLLYPLVVLAIWAIRPRLDRLQVLGYLTGLAAVVSITLGALNPEKGVFTAIDGNAIAPEKQILPWGILVGPFTQGNNLGEFLALGLPAIAFIPRRFMRAVVAAVTIFAVVWTSSRSSLLAIVVGTLVASTLAVTPRQALRAVAVPILLVLTSLIVILPLSTTDNRAFTNRGYVWRASLSRWWAEDPLFGLGSRWYSAAGLGDTAYHGHNQLVHTLVVGGLINIVLVGCLIMALVLAAGRWARAGITYPAVFVAMLLVGCMVEVSFGFVDRGYLLATGILPAAFVAFAPMPPAAVERR